MLTFKYLLVIFYLFAMMASCSIRPVAESDISQNKHVRRIHSDTDPVQIITSKQDQAFSFSVKNLDFSIDMEKPVRVKYDLLYYEFINLIAVKGSSANGKSYPVWIDTGYDHSVLTNGLTILENDLAIYPLGQDHNQEYFGLCYLPVLRIGDMAIVNPPCQYLQRHWQLSFLGLPLWKQTGFLIGLNLLDSFSYLRFNNIDKELEFSLKESFQPQSPQDWSSFPMATEFDKKKGYRLMVQIPIGTQARSIAFDTCGRYGMVLTDDAWKTISDTCQDAVIRDDKFSMGFSNWLSCRKAKVPALHIAGRTIKNAELIIQNNDAKDIFRSYISMTYFRDTELVLDFEKNLMWIKNR